MKGIMDSHRINVYHKVPGISYKMALIWKKSKSKPEKNTQNTEHRSIPMNSLHIFNAFFCDCQEIKSDWLCKYGYMTIHVCIFIRIFDASLFLATNYKIENMGCSMLKWTGVQVRVIWAHDDNRDRYFHFFFNKHMYYAS